MEKIFKSLDVNKNNVINYTEFLAACLEAQGELAEFRLAEAFDLMDSDDSGYISRENLRTILGEHGNKRSIDQLLAEIECKKGKISYDEFLRVFSRQTKMAVSEIVLAL
jgi:calcium-dependent protein kinase